MPKLKPPKEEGVSEEGETLEPIIGEPTWSGSLSIGLVNIPVRVVHHHREEDQLSYAAPEVQNSHFLQAFLRRGGKFLGAR